LASTGTDLTYTVPQFPNHKTKLKQARQRSCSEKNEKGKLCNGHLKRWYYETDVLEKKCGDIVKQLGEGAEIYRCEHCKTLYFPHPDDIRGLNVAGVGKLSVFGLTIKK
jgi:hypothetical protein